MNNWSVLLVDDEREFVTTLAERLSLRGLEVRTAFDGEECLRMIGEAPPQVVILDMMMPGTGGIEVLKRIRRNHSEVRVILLSGNTSGGDGEEGIRLGAVDYLVKPVLIEELIGKIAKAVQTPMD